MDVKYFNRRKKKRKQDSLALTLGDNTKHATPRHPYYPGQDLARGRLRGRGRV